MKASLDGVIIAESAETIVIENNHYFPPASIRGKYFLPSSTPYTCWWKGKCTYFSVKIDGREHKNVAWTYEQPLQSAIDRVGHDFSNYIAFWKGVTVS
jgi:uncharacterized protein (DUF427 family)